MALNSPQSMSTIPVDTRPKTLRSDDRERWDRELGFVRKEVDSGEPFALADAILVDYQAFEAAMRGEERALIAHPLQWTDEDLAFGRWIEGTYYTLARSAAKVMARILAREKVTDADRSLSAKLAAVSLAAAGSSIKWAQIADAGRRPTLANEMQTVHSLAVEKSVADVVTELPVHDERVSTPLTPIFVRALLLDALCHGNLRRQQIGAIDCWLWEWVPAYPLVSGAVEGARIGAGTAGKGSASGADSARSISLEAMAGHLELVTNWFRDGRIFPGHGVAADLRVEDLVAALDVLRDFLVASRQKGGSRQAREARMEAVQVLVGLPEILDDGFRSGGSGSEDDALLTAADLRGGNAADPIAGIAALFEPNIRMMDLMDASAGGIGLEYDDAATPLEVGTLLGVRLDPVQPVVLCEVVRRLAAPGRRSRIGTRVLQGDKRRIRLESAKWPKGIDAVFLAGEDPSGRGDTLVLSGTACDPEIVHEAALGGRNFHLRVSRVRRRGHGWAMAAFEFVDGPPQEEKPGGGASAR